jgi:hypothetical protein
MYAGTNQDHNTLIRSMGIRFYRPFVSVEAQIKGFRHPDSSINELLFTTLDPGKEHIGHKLNGYAPIVPTYMLTTQL